MTKIKIVFTVYGDNLEPNEFSKLCKQVPSSFGFKGEQIKGRKVNLLRKETFWEHTIGFNNTFILENITKKFEKKFNPVIEEISMYLDNNNIESKVYVVVEFSKEEMPSLFLGQNFLNLISKIKAEIEFDLYCI